LHKLVVAVWDVGIPGKLVLRVFELSCTTDGIKKKKRLPQSEPIGTMGRQQFKQIGAYH
jgi:hypothetical protein